MIYLHAVDSGTDFFGDVAEATSKIQKMSNNLVSNTMGKLYEKMVPELQGGLDSLYNKKLCCYSKCWYCKSCYRCSRSIDSKSQGFR